MHTSVSRHLHVIWKQVTDFHQTFHELHATKCFPTLAPATINNINITVVRTSEVKIILQPINLRYTNITLHEILNKYAPPQSTGMKSVLNSNTVYYDITFESRTADKLFINLLYKLNKNVKTSPRRLQPEIA
jgi:hypothetical protein